MLWLRLIRSMRDLSDPDAQPTPPEQLKDFKRVSDFPLIRKVRFSLRLTRQEFSDRFALPVADITAWEREEREPDAAAQSLLYTIEAHPEAVADAVAKAKAQVEPVDP